MWVRTKRSFEVEKVATIMESWSSIWSQRGRENNHHRRPFFVLTVSRSSLSQTTIRASYTTSTFELLAPSLPALFKDTVLWVPELRVNLKSSEHHSSSLWVFQQVHEVSSEQIQVSSKEFPDSSEIMNSPASVFEGVMIIFRFMSGWFSLILDGRKSG